jgi:hypothetical protein
LRTASAEGTGRDHRLFTAAAFTPVQPLSIAPRSATAPGLFDAISFAEPGTRSAESTPGDHI